MTERVKGLLCKAQGQPPLQHLLKHSHSLLRWRSDNMNMPHSEKRPWRLGREDQRPHVLVLLIVGKLKGRSACTRCQNVFHDAPAHVSRNRVTSQIHLCIVRSFDLYMLQIHSCISILLQWKMLIVSEIKMNININIITTMSLGYIQP